MGEPAPVDAAAVALEAARQRMSVISDNLANTRTIAIFDEKLGAVDYARWRREITQAATNAGQDFKAALLTKAVLNATAEYTEAMVHTNDMHGVPTRSIPQTRQVGLLALMRNALGVGSESAMLIESSQHAGGKILIDGVETDQALLSLNRGWSDGGVDVNAGADAKSLYKMRWPTEFGTDAYNAHFNTAVSTAGKVGQAPLGSNGASILLRQGWWHVIASPPSESVYYHGAASEARTITRQK